MSSDGLCEPTARFYEALARARTMCGAGMGFNSLQLLTDLVEATRGARWVASSTMEGALTEVDGDITQAIQSSKEQIEADLVEDMALACATAARLRITLQHSKEEIGRWGGEYPFEKAFVSTQYWNF